jgi:hypothetical protein
LCREEAEARGYYGELNHKGLDKHHIIHGTANRKKSEDYGLWCYVCRARHHIYGPESPHGNSEVDLHLKQIAQREFEKIHPHELWMSEFGRNYL